MFTSVDQTWRWAEKCWELQKAIKQVIMKLNVVDLHLAALDSGFWLTGHMELIITVCVVLAQRVQNSKQRESNWEELWRGASVETPAWVEHGAWGFSAHYLWFSAEHLQYAACNVGWSFYFSWPFSISLEFNPPFARDILEMGKLLRTTHRVRMWA